MRIWTIVSGILMVLTGAFCFMNPGQTFLSLAFIVGLVMVINGPVSYTHLDVYKRQLYIQIS